MKKQVLWILLMFFVCSNLVFAEEAEKDKKVYPQKVEVDKNYDGVIDSVEYYQNQKIVRREEDTDFDGTMDSWISYDENGKPVKSERDTNKDGKPDTWVQY